MPPTLAAAVRDQVSPKFRSRGVAYFRNGSVTIVKQEPGRRVMAQVAGEYDYDVSLELLGGRLKVECDCPLFERSLDVCKHIWATILAADARSLLTPVANEFVAIDTVPDGDEFVENQDDTVRGTAVPAPPPAATPDARPLTRSERMKQYWAQRRAMNPASPAPASPKANPQARPQPPLEPPPEPPAWQTFLSAVRPAPTRTASAERRIGTGQFLYVLDLGGFSKGQGLTLDFMLRERKKSGDWGKPKLVSLSRSDVAHLPDEDDRWLLEAILGAAPPGGWQYGYAWQVPSSVVLSPALQVLLVPRLCATGRLMMRRAEIPGASAGTGAGAPSDAAAGTPTAGDQFVPLQWDPESASFELRVAGDSAAGYTVSGRLTRAGVEHPFANVIALTQSLMLWASDAQHVTPVFSPFEAGTEWRWLERLVRMGPVTIPADRASTLLQALAMAQLTPAECPEELRLEWVEATPQPVVRIARHQGYAYSFERDRLVVSLAFRYDDREVDAWSPDPVVVDLERRRSWRRKRDVEAEALQRLTTLGARRIIDWQTHAPSMDLAVNQMPAMVKVLSREGWRVEAEGRLHRTAGTVALEVRSGIDWFELHGSIDFDGVSAGLPELLSALKRGESFVQLGDGSVGQLPEAWLARNGWIAQLGTAQGDHVRFGRAQTALLSAWLATQPKVSYDEAFARVRDQLATFERIVPQDAPKTFHGELRGYQQEALGWFAFLRQFGFGGCLADEMGLGKTVMVLAGLEARRLERKRDRLPSLIVVPRSLVFNWQDEAKRFAPKLRVLDCSGADRHDMFDRLGDADVVLTTYGTMRRDIARLKEIPFDYVILDESQAVKNARTGAAMAVRLLKARHRLALSGTPIENHLGELWSLFEFLNPGVLGAASVFKGGASQRNVDEEGLAALARGLRPFFLRRTKEVVAAELPSRTEQTLYCELESKQRALYNQLRTHYRNSLLKRITRDGIARSKMHVLEALLRLRQAACHPGLIDPSRTGEESAKLDALVPRLQELAEDGRKVLVFSQFTSLLALLQPRLAEAGLLFAYLDGQTKDRAAVVREFEKDGCPVFLISLKAGGVGLNLTAAEYVFLLDPWWNPAVEAQAIDRAHRIGQTKPVFAYRLIARDTVEEKVLELQATKRQLAEAIVRADESLIRTLGREDLELLLS